MEVTNDGDDPNQGAVRRNRNKGKHKLDNLRLGAREEHKPWGLLSSVYVEEQTIKQVPETS